MQYKLVLEYDGTGYRGWQVQPAARTVQGEVEAALSRLLNMPTRVRVGGRTDAGVHARGQVASFRTPRPLDSARFRHSLNCVLPADVSVSDVAEVPEAFDPRSDARSRVYRYRIWNRPYPSALHARFAWHVPRALDRAAMHEAAALLVGEHDFSSFQGADSVERTPWRIVLRSEVARDEGFLIYDVEARSFARHMVRNIVGTLVDVGRGALSLDEFSRIFAARDRSRAGATAPPQGLFLVAVRYGASGMTADSDLLPLALRPFDTLRQAQSGTELKALQAQGPGGGSESAPDVTRGRT